MLLVSSKMSCLHNLDCSGAPNAICKRLAFNADNFLFFIIIKLFLQTSDTIAVVVNNNKLIEVAHVFWEVTHF